MRHVCALLCLWSTLAPAETTLDPFNTEAALPTRPALHLEDAGGDPCAAAMPSGALDLLEVVHLALCNNPQTRQVWASARVQAAQLGASQASYLPSASLSASGNRSSPGTSQRNIGLTLSYLLYDFGARAASLENARQLLTAANATHDSTVQTVFLQAVQSFYQVQASQAALDAALESERAAKESFTAAEARYTVGSATPADKLQAQTAWSQASLNRITANGNLNNTRGTLANMLGLDAHRNIPLVAANAIAAPAGFDRDISALIEEARQRRPDLQAAEAQVKAAEASADAARAARLPTLSLTASTSQTSSAGITSHGSSVGLSASVPLFSGYAPTYRVRAAEAQVETQKAQMERLRLQVAMDVWTAYQNLVTATQSVRTTADLLGSAEQSERVALGRYKAGVGSILDVLNAQSALASARQQRIQSTFDWNINRAALAQAMGSLDMELLQELSAGSRRTGAPHQRKNQP